LELMESAGKARQRNLEERAVAETELKAARDAWNSARQRGVDEQRLWTERAAEAGFDDEAAYLDARIEPSAQADMASEIAQYEENVNRAAVRLKDAEKAVEGVETPDIARLETAAETARQTRERMEREHTRLSLTVSDKKRAAADLQNTAVKLEQVEGDYAVVGRLSLVANGQNSQRLSFQRFVLGALLDDVLVAASQRLRRMSKGRYMLERVREQGDQRVHGGLDLQVDDAYTGKVRPVSSLSGGESFLAALSLALGLAEVVEAYAGGVRLDTIFIDEGFGSLDPEALDLAVNTLVDLQSTGRLVGVISHVPELKERIDVRLELSSNRGSSSAAFVLP
jgi:exonuclease SbcC